MKGLLSTIDLDFLIYRRVEIIQFALNPWMVQVHFDENVHIVIESTIAVTSEGSSIRIENFHSSASRLCALIGLQVIDVNRMSDGGIFLQISDDKVIEIMNSNENFESFQLHNNWKIYVA